jgi:hypothetical protein
MIAVYRRRYGATTDYEIAWVTAALPDLRDPAHRRLCTEVVRRTQPRHLAAPASLLALAAWQSGHGAIQARASRNGERQHDFAEWPPRSSTTPTRIWRRLPVLTSCLTLR